RLKSGAAYVKQIIEAMGTEGGTKEVLAAMGNVILAALKDGAEYIGVKILNAFDKTKSIFGEARVKIAVMAGTDEAEARKTVYGDQAEYKGGAFDKALKDFSQTIKENAKHFPTHVGMIR
ncbi:MAG: hypothetical protein GX748_15390, partial [Lentisphaerae bacterium]|nr:hypothetical protein [Lentisphaerota bacterium]